MNVKELLLIDEATVASLLTLDEAMKAVEKAYTAQVAGQGRLFPVVKEKYTDLNSFSLKSGVMTELNTVGVKAAGSWRGNGAKGLPTVQATVVLVDPDTGEPLAIIAGKNLTTLRTGAAGGVAAKTLSRADSKVLAVIGTGVQGEIQTEAAFAARPGITTIRACDPMGGHPAKFIERFKDRAEIIVAASPADAVKGADIIITATPSATPLIDFEHVTPGAHINAMGCDSKGKREIGQNLLEKARRFVDSAEQARSIGEHQYGPELPVTEIGSILLGRESFQRGDGDVSLFDSTGIAFQDLAAARQVYDLVVKAGAGQRIAWPT